jgi:hypothetical protein
MTTQCDRCRYYHGKIYPVFFPGARHILTCALWPGGPAELGNCPDFEPGEPRSQQQGEAS